jgi:hypothetical protein
VGFLVDLESMECLVDLESFVRKKKERQRGRALVGRDRRAWEGAAMAVEQLT